MKGNSHGRAGEGRIIASRPSPGDPMTERKFVVTYDAIAADILDNGIDQPAALVLVSSDQQRVIIRMDRQAVARLKKRIERTFLRRYRGVARLHP